MAKIIELIDIKINTIGIDYENQRVLVDFSMVDNTQKVWSHGQAIFWVTIPDPGQDEFGNPLPVPINWFQLPSGYISTLVSMRNDADQAITNRFLI